MSSLRPRSQRSSIRLSAERPKEETGVPGGNPRKHEGEHAKSTRKDHWGPKDSNLEPSCCEATMLTTKPPCRPRLIQKNTKKDVLSEEPNKGVRAPWRNSEGKFASRVLRLNNNLLSNMTGLTETLSALFIEPKRLAWLDLSFNDITHIHPVLTELMELRVLYLHGNSVCNFSEVDKLRTLPLLHTITLHGNNIETRRGYRNYVIIALPHLKMMDFSAITKQERVTASIWHRSTRGRKPTDRSTNNI